jgi:hypothetical protein
MKKGTKGKNENIKANTIGKRN